MSATSETVSHIVSWLIVYLILVDSCRMFGDNAGFVLKHVPYSEIRRMGEWGSWIHDRASATESMIGDVRESSIDDRLSTYIVEDPGTGIPLQYACFHGRTPDSMTDMGTTTLGYEPHL